MLTTRHSQVILNRASYYEYLSKGLEGFARNVCVLSKHIPNLMRFANSLCNICMQINIAIFWDVMPCNMKYRTFEGSITSVFGTASLYIKVTECFFMSDTLITLYYSYISLSVYCNITSVMKPKAPVPLHLIFAPLFKYSQPSWNPKFHCHVHESPSLNLGRSQIKSAHNITRVAL
jgi:hypothetical protein